MKIGKSNLRRVESVIANSGLCPDAAKIAKKHSGSEEYFHKLKYFCRYCIIKKRLRDRFKCSRISALKEAIVIKNWLYKLEKIKAIKEL